MQKLFPQKGNTIPGYRFPEFKEDDTWKKKELREIIKVNSGKDYKHLGTGNIPVYGTGGYMLSVDGKLSDIDAVGIGRKGTIDRPQYLKAPFWTVDTLFFLTNNKGYDIKFIYYLSQIIPWKKYGEQTGVPSLSKTSIENLEVMVPFNINEQKKIAQVFSSLDDEIILLERKSALLENHKKGLMQQLFPNII
jgi:type I restriction enzyme S subunit